MPFIRAVLSSNNLKNICRVCLEENSDSVDFNSIMEFQNIDVASIEIVDILQKIAPTQVIQSI